VYEGWGPIIARRVAIKTVKLPDNADDQGTEEALARFRREAQAAGRLIHPNIATSPKSSWRSDSNIDSTFQPITH
jgi:serine/threonine-protein kinase